jgi:hypothetical protein
LEAKEVWTREWPSSVGSLSFEVLWRKLWALFCTATPPLSVTPSINRNTTRDESQRYVPNDLIAKAMANKQGQMLGVKRSYDGAEKQQEAKVSPFTPMFETFRSELDEHHDRRERIIKASRDITAASKKM